MVIISGNVGLRSEISLYFIGRRQSNISDVIREASSNLGHDIAILMTSFTIKKQDKAIRK